jgi:hypothetical protein
VIGLFSGEFFAAAPPYKIETPTATRGTSANAVSSVGDVVGMSSACRQNVVSANEFPNKNKK